MTDLAKRSDDDILDEALADSAMGAALEEELGVHPQRFAIFLGVLAFITFLGGWKLLVIVMALVVFIVIHELGHYLTARWSGMKVTEFFIGFGPQIVAVKRGETTYGIKAIPAGAYVRIIGMNNLDEVAPEDEPRAYRNAPWHKRMLTIAAGPLSHFVIAFVIATVFVWQIGQEVDGEWEVKQTIPFSAAEDAGLLEGDQVLAIAGRSTIEFDALSDVLDDVRGEIVPIEVERNGEIITLEARIGERLTAVGSQGVSGLYAGDMVLAIDGLPVANYAEFANLATGYIGEQVDVEIVYGLESHTETVTINEVAAPDDAVEGFLGVASGAIREPRSAGSSMSAGAELVGESTKFLVTEVPSRMATRTGLAALFGVSSPTDVQAEEIVNDPEQIRPVSLDENRVISIIGATQLATELAEQSWADALFFLIILNVSFGLLNALPLLPLDGGHMVIATYERVRSFGGRMYHADAAKMLPVTYAVIFIFMLIGGIAMMRDILDPINLDGL